MFGNFDIHHINVKDFEKIEKRIQEAARKIDADPELTQEEKDKKFMDVLNHYTGPDTGLVWSDETGKVGVASGWAVDTDGYVVRE